MKSGYSEENSSAPGDEAPRAEPGSKPGVKGEAEARERFGEIDVYRSTFRELRHTLTGRETKTLMKLLVDRESQRVVGAHMLGAHAGEIVQGVAIAVKCGATKAQVDATVGIHPTAAEEFVTMREPVSS